KTVDHVLIAQGSQSWGAANREQFYVSASRGRKSVKIFTDDREALLESVLGTSGRVSGHDLLGRGEKADDTETIAREEKQKTIAAIEDAPVVVEEKIAEAPVVVEQKVAPKAEVEPPAPLPKVPDPGEARLPDVTELSEA